MVVCIAAFTKAIMSIPPLLSSSPPPLEENGSICNDDFGDFSDYASVGAVSSATSVNESASAFRPIDSAELSSGLYLGDADPEPKNLQEIDEWTAFDAAVLQHSSDIVQTDSVNSVSGQTLLAHESLSGDVCDGENPLPDCVTHETGTSELPSLSLSTSPVIVSEQLSLEDVSDSCCDDENLHNEELTVEKFDDDLCANVNACSLSVDTNPPCKMEEMLEDEESSSDGDNCYYEFDNDVDLAVQENDSTDYDYVSFNESSTVISDRSEHAFANDNQLALDENDFEGNFQSFSSYVESHQHTEAQTSVCNSEKIAFSSDYSRPEDTTSETDSVVAADQAEIVLDDQPLTHQQMLTSNDEQMDDDFDDFEEFVAAKQGPAEHLPIVDSTAHEWNAFESTAADDDWAAFQDSDGTHTTKSCIEISTVNVFDIQQPPVTYSGRLSKVYSIQNATEIFWTLDT